MNIFFFYNKIITLYMQKKCLKWYNLNVFETHLKTNQKIIFSKMSLMGVKSSCIEYIAPIIHCAMYIHFNVLT